MRTIRERWWPNNPTNIRIWRLSGPVAAARQDQQRGKRGVFGARTTDRQERLVLTREGASPPEAAHNSDPVGGFGKSFA